MTISYPILILKSHPERGFGQYKTHEEKENHRTAQDGITLRKTNSGRKGKEREQRKRNAQSFSSVV